MSTKTTQGEEIIELSQSLDLTPEELTRSKASLAWGKLCQEYRLIEKINNDGQVIVTADQIRRFREPRLMTKFDHAGDRPAIFIKHKLSILPLNRKEFVLAPVDAYYKFPPLEVSVNKAPVTQVALPTEVESLELEEFSSEAVALNAAYCAGIFEDFLDDKPLYPTISGRKTSGDFDFFMENKKQGRHYCFHVSGSQMEIDASFEGASALALIEAKNKIADDFLIRQLYYPYRALEQSARKPVRNLFFVQSNKIFDLYEYAFTDLMNYQSCELVKHHRYSLVPVRLSIKVLLGQMRLGAYPTSVPFPQADSLERIMNLCEMVRAAGQVSAAEIATYFSFTHRQGGYYRSAGLFLGFLEKCGSGQVRLSSKGRSVFTASVSAKERRQHVALAVLGLPIFHEVFRYMASGAEVSRRDVLEVMSLYGELASLGETTLGRRVQTVLSWCGQIFIWCKM